MEKHTCMKFRREKICLCSAAYFRKKRGCFANDIHDEWLIIKREQPVRNLNMPVICRNNMRIPAGNAHDYDIMAIVNPDRRERIFFSEKAMGYYAIGLEFFIFKVKDGFLGYIRLICTTLKQRHDNARINGHLRILHYS